MSNTKNTENTMNKTDALFMEYLTGYKNRFELHLLSSGYASSAAALKVDRRITAIVGVWEGRTAWATCQDLWAALVEAKVTWEDTALVMKMWEIHVDSFKVRGPTRVQVSKERSAELRGQCLYLAHQHGWIDDVAGHVYEISMALGGVEPTFRQYEDFMWYVGGLTVGFKERAFGEVAIAGRGESLKIGDDTYPIPEDGDWARVLGVTVEVV